ncbi:MAG: hypothetical protein M3R64_11465 [Pseudomonadota bacterium]|nr:hypothetical protein [Pseudomonadota bacterium]
MTTVDIAERKSTLRAIFFLCFAAALLLLLLAIFSGGPDFLNGLWAGLMLGAALNLTPVARWLKPNSAITRMLDDESTRDRRGRATTAGFWAAFAASIVLTVVARYDAAMVAYDAVRVIGTAAMMATLIAFATLELRANR